MVFPYYQNLSPRNKRIYDKSDAITTFPLPAVNDLSALATRLQQALAAEDRKKVALTAGQLCQRICRDLGTELVGVKVLARRPSGAASELHGLYIREEGRMPVIQVWMKTAQRQQTVAYRTFLRTLLHEFCHHLDYALFRLPDSLHTEGFFKRENHLFHQLVPSDCGPEPARNREAAEAVPSQPELPL